MNFNSYEFVLCYLPIVVILWYQLNKLAGSRYAKLMLVVASLIFYGFNNFVYVFLIIGSIGINYFCYLLMRKGRAERKKMFLLIGVILDIGILFYFKYYDFFVENFNYVVDTDFNLKNLILPLGISFYTFQQIGFLADCYRGEVKELSFLDYCLFVTFFPQLVAGPIVEYNEMLPQFNDAGKKHVKRNRTWV